MTCELCSSPSHRRCGHTTEFLLQASRSVKAHRQQTLIITNVLVPAHGSVRAARLEREGGAAQTPAVLRAPHRGPAAALRWVGRNPELLPALRVARQRQGRRRRAELRAQVLPRRRPASGPAAGLAPGQRRRRLREPPAPGRSGAASRAAPGRVRAVPPRRGPTRSRTPHLPRLGARTAVPRGPGPRTTSGARAGGRPATAGRTSATPPRPSSRAAAPSSSAAGRIVRGLRRGRPLPGVSQRAGRGPLRGLPDRVPRPRRLPQVRAPAPRPPRRLQHVRVDDSEEERLPRRQADSPAPPARSARTSAPSNQQNSRRGLISVST